MALPLNPNQDAKQLPAGVYTCDPKADGKPGAKAEAEAAAEAERPLSDGKPDGKATSEAAVVAAPAVAAAL